MQRNEAAPHQDFYFPSNGFVNRWNFTKKSVCWKELWVGRDIASWLCGETGFVWVHGELDLWCVQLGATCVFFFGWIIYVFRGLWPCSTCKEQWAETEELRSHGKHSTSLLPFLAHVPRVICVLLFFLFFGLRNSMSLLFFFSTRVAFRLLSNSMRELADDRAV
jgi:hypothetical protein